MQRQNTADKVVECSDPRGAQAVRVGVRVRGHREVDGGRGSEGAGGNKAAYGEKVVDAVKCIQ